MRTAIGNCTEHRQQTPTWFDTSPMTPYGHDCILDGPHKSGFDSHTTHHARRTLTYMTGVWP